MRISFKLNFIRGVSCWECTCILSPHRFIKFYIRNLVECPSSCKQIRTIDSKRNGSIITVRVSISFCQAQNQLIFSFFLFQKLECYNTAILVFKYCCILPSYKLKMRTLDCGRRWINFNIQFRFLCDFVRFPFQCFKSDSIGSTFT